MPEAGAMTSNASEISRTIFGVRRRSESKTVVAKATRTPGIEISPRAADSVGWQSSAGTVSFIGRSTRRLRVL
jgi:hypothetical protein